VEVPDWYAMREALSVQSFGYVPLENDPQKTAILIITAFMILTQNGGTGQQQSRTPRPGHTNRTPEGNP